MKKIKILSFIGLLLITLISNAQKPRYLKTDTYEGVIFPKFWATSPQRAKYEFFPTDKEIATMEKKLTDSIGALLSTFEKKDNYGGHCDIIVQNLRKFKRQYCGSWYKGDKVIYAYFFLDVPDNWKQIMIITGGSGNRSCKEFRINYSISSGKFLAFFTDLSPL
jgi:hypothetical protein